MAIVLTRFLTGCLLGMFASCSYAADVQEAESMPEALEVCRELLFSGAITEAQPGRRLEGRAFAPEIQVPSPCCMATSSICVWESLCCGQFGKAVITVCRVVL